MAVAAQTGEMHQTLGQQYENLTQQNECYVVGMWTFLVTEIMFFGGLFLDYVLYRLANPDVFRDMHKHLNVFWGGLNTMILLTSSLFMALAVHAAQTGQRKKVMAWLVTVILCAFGFLGIKYIEYSAKFEHHRFPGPTFTQNPFHGVPGLEKQSEAAEAAERGEVASTPAGVERG